MKGIVLSFAVLAALAASAAKKDKKEAEEPAGRPEAVVAMLNSSVSGSPKAYSDAVAAVAEDAAAGCSLQKFVIALFNGEKSMPAKLKVSEAVRAEYYEKGRKRIEDLAAQSNPLALYLLAIDTGDTNTLRRAAEGGNVQAANAWGLALMSDVDGPLPDESAKETMKKAFRFFRDAAALRDANGLYNMGTCYARGLGTEQDAKRAYECFKSAADKGHPQAINNLGWCHLKGMGVKEDHTEAAKCFAKSADYGNAEGQLNYALALLSGDGVEVNHRTAASLLLQSARQDNLDAMNAYGVCISKGRGVKSDPALAAKWFRAAAERGHPPAMDNLASCYELGEGLEKSEELAVYWHMRSLAARGDAYATKWLEERNKPKP